MSLFMSVPSVYFTLVMFCTRIDSAMVSLRHFSFWGNNIWIFFYQNRIKFNLVDVYLQSSLHLSLFFIYIFNKLY